MTTPRVSFYVLPEAGRDARLRFACRLVEKAYLQEQRVTVHCPTPEIAQELDELLWRFSDQSFVPHELVPPGSGQAVPVVIRADGQAGEPAQVLVNLADDVPGWYAGFERVAEILDASEDCRRSGRERFRHYRENGLEPETHKLGTA
jgi:DNA polymerase-3 subunit chi